MVNRSQESNAFEFVVVASLRTQQLIRGCLARVPRGTHKATTTAQLEIVAGKVAKLIKEPVLAEAGESATPMRGL